MVAGLLEVKTTTCLLFASLHPLLTGKSLLKTLCYMVVVCCDLGKSHRETMLSSDQFAQGFVLKMSREKKNRFSRFSVQSIPVNSLLTVKDVSLCQIGASYLRPWILECPGIFGAASCLFPGRILLMDAVFRACSSVCGPHCYILFQIVAVSRFSAKLLPL